MTEQSEIKLKKEYYSKLIEVQQRLVASLKYVVEANKHRSDIKTSGFEDVYKYTKLQIELIEAEIQLAYNEDYLIHYTKRDTDHEKFMRDLTIECNVNFDKIMQVAKDLPSRKQNYNDDIKKFASNAVDLVTKIDLNDQGKKNDLYKLLRDQFDQNKVMWR